MRLYLKKVLQFGLCIALLGTSISFGETSSTITRIVNEDLVRSWFPNAPRENVNKYTPYILQAIRDAKWDNDNSMIAYVFGTIAAETSDFSPSAERINTNGPYANTLDLSRPFGRYDEDIATALKLGNSIYGGKDSIRLHEMHGDPFVDYENGRLYRGRGFIQLTGRYNYRRYGILIGINDELEAQPDLAEDPKYASLLLVAFLKLSEGKIKDCLAKQDFQCARSQVNPRALGLDRFRRVYDAVKSALETPQNYMQPSGLSATVS